MKKKICILIGILIIIMIVNIVIILSNRMQEEKQAEFMIENATLNGKNATYQNPIIPKGFRINKTGASWKIKGDIIEGWNEGLVIEDEKGNEFVWVPVEGGVTEDSKEIPQKVEYKKWVMYRIELSVAAREMFKNPDEELLDIFYTEKTVTEDTLPDGVESEYDQINKYGGFYIARYEAGISEEDLKQIYSLEDNYTFLQVSDKNNIDTIVPISKKYAQVWNNIEYHNVKTVSEKMYQTEEVKSGLMTGRQFDTILTWANLSGYPLNDGAKWGNYLDTVNQEYKGAYSSYLRKHLQDWKIEDYGLKDKENFIITRTGGVESSKMNNIYDLAGNVYDFTTDLLRGEYGVLRGGCAAYKGDETSKHQVYVYDLGDSFHYVYGFRVVLYIS